ncbi:MAG: translation initiation factor eIF-2B [Chloroflexota bacterium]
MSQALQIVHDIEEMKVRGAALITQQALRALDMRARELAPQGAQACRDGLLAAAQRLIAAQPSMASVENGCNFVVAPLKEEQSSAWAVAQITETIAARAAVFLKHSQRAQEAVVQTGATLLRDGSTVFVHSYSGTLLGILRSAWESGKRFAVIGTESRPYGEGRVLAAALVALGVPYTLVTDAAMAHSLPRADVALVGVDTWLASGAVVNKMGTLPLALACRYHGKPLYAAGTSFKFSAASQRGQVVGLKARPDDAGIAPAELSGDPRLTVENLFFEIIPAHLFEGTVTEYGIQPPFALPALWARTETSLTEEAA